MKISNFTKSTTTIPIKQVQYAFLFFSEQQNSV